MRAPSSPGVLQRANQTDADPETTKLFHLDKAIEEYPGLIRKLDSGVYKGEKTYKYERRQVNVDLVEAITAPSKETFGYWEEWGDK